MRSKAEISFRARQELKNFLLLLAPPKLSADVPLSLALPDARSAADALHGSQYANDLEIIAEKILAHRFPVLGIELETGQEIHWRRDYVHAKESGSRYFRRIPYLDFAAVGDHKIVWELNRHSHLVLLAQAFLVTHRKEYVREIIVQLESWLAQNQFQRGINWASALEVAFRALSWTWLYHLIAPEMPDGFRRRFFTELYRHGHHLRENLSVYFSPNTHLLGEAVALHALGKLFRAFPQSEEWAQRGAEIVNAQLDFQVVPDGSHFEQSTYYHVYALDFFLLHYLLADRPAKFEPVLMRMADYLHWLLGPARRIALVGDDDGGRLFHPYGQRDQFGRATLATCGILFDRPEWFGTEYEIAEQAIWWLGPQALAKANSKVSIASGARLFSNSGAAFLDAGDLHLQMDCGPFGWGGAGHSHSDTLSVVLSLRGEWVLIDPGTYTYIAEPAQRNWFRGSGAHNTVRVDGLDQACPAGPFRWSAPPDVKLTRWEPAASGGVIEAECCYRGFTHLRQVTLESHRLTISDEIQSSSDGEHVCEQIWQLGPAAEKVNFTCSAPTSSDKSNFSPAYGAILSGKSLTVRISGHLPCRIVTIIETGGNGSVSADSDAVKTLLTLRS